MSELELFALMGKLYAENQLLRQQLAVLQAQLQEAQANGKNSEPTPAKQQEPVRSD